MQLIDVKLQRIVSNHLSKKHMYLLYMYPEKKTLYIIYNIFGF